jgi:biotin synthase
MLALSIRSTRAHAPALRRALATHASAAPDVAPAAAPVTRHDWARGEIQAIYDSPLLDLVFRAASVHRLHHDPSKIQLCTLMNIKGACPLVRRLHERPHRRFPHRSRRLQ